jgi:hypothetical protein
MSTPGRIHSATAAIHLLLALAFGCPAGIQVQAQDPDGKPSSRGVQPGGSYALSELETVQLNGGNLSYAIPLAALPPSRGGKLRPAVSLLYNSRLYDTKVTIASGSQNYTQTDLVMPQTGAGWRYGVWYQLDVRDRSTNYLNTVPYPWNTFKYSAAIIFPDGSRHTIRPCGYAPYAGTDYYSVYPGSGAQNYYSTDSTYFRANITTSGWTLYLADGSTVAYDNTSGVQTVTDSNGNFYTVRNVTLSGGIPATEVTDQFGRKITIESPVGGPDRVRINGYGGTQEVITTISWTTTTCQGKRYLWRVYTDSTETWKNFTSSRQMVSRITLPTSQTYQFAYNSEITDPNNPGSSVGWGELYKVTLPNNSSTLTAPYVQYSYSLDYVHGFTSDVYPSDVLHDYPTQKQLSYTEAYDGSTTGRTDTWTYGITFYGDAGAVSAFVTAPDGGTTSENYYDPNDLNLEGLAYRTVHPDGSTTERIWALNMPYNGNGTKVNTYVKTEFNSITSAAGVLTKTAIRDYTY